MNAFAQSAKLSDQLSTMRDDTLQQMAQQYKDDAITLSLILHETNRRKRVRGAASAQQAAQPQPKVNDAVVASMAAPMPEDVGIGQLPTPNMERMAGGGLVAFADGGDVDRYQNKGSVEGISPALMAQYEKEVQEMGEGRRMQFSPEIRPIVAQLQAPRRAAEQDYLQREQARMLQGPALRAAPTATPTAPAPVAPAAQPGPTPQELAQFDAATNLYMTERAARQAKERGSAPPAGPRPPTAPGAAPAAAAVDALAQYKKDIEGFKPAAAKTPQQIMAERQALVPEEYRGKAHEGLEKSLRGEADSAAQEKQQAFWMSVMQAGLSTAAGSSPNALKNIADGLGAGLSSYKDSLAQFKKAEKERQKMLADIEQSRRAEARGDADAALKARDRAEEREDKFNGYAMQGIASLRGQEMQERGASARANAQLQATLSSPERQVFNALVQKNKGNVAAAYAEMQSAKREPVSRDAALKTWSSDMLIQQKFPNFEDYFRMAQGTAPMGGASQISPSDAALVNKYLSPPR